MILTLEEAYKLLENASAVLIGEGVTFPRLAPLSGEEDNEFLYLGWWEDGRQHDAIFREGENTTVDLCGSSIGLMDNEGDSVQITLLDGISTDTARSLPCKTEIPPDRKLEQRCELPSAVIVDIDGTLAHRTDRDVFDFDNCGSDKVNVPVLNAINVLGKAYKIIFVTGRQEKFRQATLDWLCANCGWACDGANLLMRSTGDQRDDSIVKEEIYREHILPNYYVQFALDDRDRVVNHLRALGIAVFQVQPGDF